MKLRRAKIGEKINFFYLENDRYIGQRAAVGKYEPYETQLILRQAKVGGTVIDVGANIGYYTLILADKVGKNGKVYAFEPDKINFEILEKNIKENKLKNVVAIKAAIGSKNESKILYKSEENLGDHKLYKPKTPAKKREKVKIVRLDSFIKEKMDLIKIDTQGWEPEVIEGAKEMIKKNKPVIFLEYSPASYREAGMSGKRMMEFLRKVYRKIWWIDEWLYIYKNLSQEKIDEICTTNKTGYADLWMKKEVGFGDKIGQIRNLKMKQWIKRLLSGYNESVIKN